MAELGVVGFLFVILISVPLSIWVLIAIGKLFTITDELRMLNGQVRALRVAMDKEAFCQNCGATIDSRSNFCFKCGASRMLAPAIVAAGSPPPLSAVAVSGRGGRMLDI